MKKKITALCLCVALLAVAVVGASLAYFTDNDQADNTFTAGSVKIQLIEQQSNADHTGFVPYDGDKVLMPIVGSAQGEKYPNGQPAAENYIDKVVTIQNTGKSAAWIRAYYAVPSDLDDGFGESFNAGMNILHGNFGNNGDKTTYENEWKWLNNGKCSTLKLSWTASATTSISRTTTSPSRPVRPPSSLSAACIWTRTWI